MEIWFLTILCDAICVARCYQLTRELQQWSGRSWRLPSDNRLKVVQFALWPFGWAVTTVLLYWLFSLLYQHQLERTYGTILCFTPPDIEVGSLLFLAAFSLYGLLEHIVIKRAMGEHALDFLFYEYDLIPDCPERRARDSTPYWQKMYGMRAAHICCLFFSIVFGVVNTIFVPMEMQHVFLVTEDAIHARGVYIDEVREKHERLADLTHIYFYEEDEYYELLFHENGVERLWRMWSANKRVCPSNISGRDGTPLEIGMRHKGGMREQSA